jgi:hypothetical protein
VCREILSERSCMTNVTSVNSVSEQIRDSIVDLKSDWRSILNFTITVDMK